MSIGRVLAAKAITRQGGQAQNVARDERLCLISVVLAFAALGLWHHLYFSYSVGEFTFFKNAYDEDSYILFPFGISGFRVDRALSGAIVTTLLWLSRGSYSLTLMALDTLLPPLIFLAAWYVSNPLFKSAWSRILFAMVLVFAFDLFSLGSIASYPGPFPTIGQFRRLFGAMQVPPMETAYLGLYRSPEPQVSWITAFVFVGLLLRVACRDDDRMTRRDVAALLVVQALLTLCYSLVGIPTLLIEGAVGALLFLSGRRRKGAVLLVLFALFVAAAMAAMVVWRDQNSLTRLFASRLPIVTVGVLGSLALTVVTAFYLFRDPRHPVLLTAFGFAAIPLVLTNQQLVTGVMASARDWERNVNLSFVVIAGGLLLAYLRRPIARHRLIMACGIGGASCFAVMSSVQTYRIWLPDNLSTLAIARAVENARPRLPPDVTLVLDKPEYASLANLRLKNTANFVLNYIETFKAPIESTPDFRPSALSRSLFEFWRRTGVTPAQARKVIDDEAAVRNGFYSGFLFNVCEYWYPCTDGRGVKEEKIAMQIPQAIDSYRSFLADTRPVGPFATVSLNPKERDRPDEKMIGEGVAGSARAVVYQAR